MPKYLIARFTAKGIQGPSKKGRRGTPRCRHQGLGEPRWQIGQFLLRLWRRRRYSIVDLPDNASAAALSLAVAQSGAVATKTVVLLTPEEMDAARNKTVDYRPPAAERAPFAGALPARRPFVLGRCAAARP